MYFYEVIPATRSYKGKSSLTYSYHEALVVGTAVIVNVRNKNVHGVVIKKTKRPNFSTKPITSTTDYVLPSHSLKILFWLSEFYGVGLGVCAQNFLSNIPSEKTPSINLEDNNKEENSIQLPPLTNEQQHTIQSISDTVDQRFILHGQTGSGKTRIYIERAMHYLDKNRSSLILTPEISLTPQLLHNFKKTFSGRPIFVVHSELKKSEKKTIWKSIYEKTISGNPVIVVGTRSALFLPIYNLGFIAVDESHENSYKQEQDPRYHGIRVAAVLARHTQSEIIYGSATPSVVDYYIGEKKGLSVLTMVNRAKKLVSETSFVISDKTNKQEYTTNDVLSDISLRKIKSSLAHKTQSLIFLNKRGTARQVLCNDCGWCALCKHCDIALTYHADKQRLYCHTCGTRYKTILECQNCTSNDIVYSSAGTKAVVEILHKFFPSAKIARFDTDISSTEDDATRQFGRLLENKIDILVGTQMIAKGLDLPHLETVIVVDADSELYLPDFSSKERSFQLLYQASGRVGRGHKKGTIVIQTRNPHSELIKQVTTQNWQSFYNSEIAERKQYLYPPFVFLLLITIPGAHPENAERSAKKIYQKINGMNLPVSASLPSPSFYTKIRGKFRWQIIIKSTTRSHLLKIQSELSNTNCICDLDPLHLL